MGLAHSPRIVTDGLVLALDAGNTKSYPGSGTSWSDLSGNSNTGTLTNGPTYSSDNGGSIVFDGTDDYVSPTGLTDAFWQSNWTASFWVNFDTISILTGGSDDKILVQHGTNSTRKGLHLDQRNSRIIFGLYFDDINSTSTVSTGTWYNIVFTLNNSSYVKQIYLNGVLDNSHTGGGAYTGTGSNTKICGQVISSLGLHLDGFMSSCSFYNRVLTASEVTQNYNALKGRYA